MTATAGQEKFRLLPRSLRARFLLLVTAAALPLLGLLIFFALQERKIREQQVRENTFRTARIAALNQREILYGARQLLVSLARNSQVQNFNAEQSRKLFQDTLHDLPLYGNLVLADLKGDVISSGRPFPGHHNVGDQAFFKQVLRTRQYAAGDYFVSPAVQRPVVAAAYPVVGSDNRLLGVLYATLLVEVFAAVATEAQLPQDGVLTLVDRNGTVVVRHPSPGAWVGKRFPDAEIVQLMLQRKQGVASLKGLDGVQREYAFAEVDRSPETNLYLNIGFSRAAFAQVDRLFAQTMLLGLTLMAAVTGAAWWFGRRWLIQPMATLAAATHRFAGGDLNARVELRDETAETKELTTAFNSMAQAIQQRESKLERAARDIRQSEERFALISRVTNDAVWDWDLSNDSLHWNEGVESLFGYKRETIPPVIQWWHEHIHPNDRFAIVHGIQQVIGAPDGREWNDDYRFRHSDGTFVHVQDRGFVIRDAAGRPVRMLGGMRDITARRLAEEASRESQQRLHGIIESAMDAVISVDVQQRIVLFNAAAEKVFGCKAQEALGTSLERFIPMRYRAYHARHVEDFGKTGVTNRAMGRLGTLTGLRRNGEEFPIEASISQVEVAGEKIYTVILRDITERKKSEQRLQESEERFRTLADNISQLAWMTNPEGAIVWYNKRWYDYTGSTFEEMQGWGWQKVHHPEYLDGVLWKFKQSLQNGEVWEDTFPLRGQDGRYRWFLSRALPIRNADGQVLRWFGTNTDITELRDAEIALRAAREDLERKVAERTQELTAALERAQEVDRLKSEFLATMSHELRTPLNSILGFTGMVKDGIAGPISEEAKHQLSFAYNSARHLLQLINDLLDLSRIEAGRMELDCAWVQVKEVVAETLGTVQLLAEQKNLRLVMTVEGDDAIYTDRKKLFQILLNLVNNAVKFTERGEVEIKARVQEHRLMVEVRDTGIGIKPEQKSMLFEAFRQVEGSAQRRFEGTGLGLYLTKKLITLLGGEIQVQSEYGKGSLFAFNIPPPEKESSTYAAADLARGR